MKIAIVLGGPLIGSGECRVAGAWSRLLTEAGHDTTLVHEAGDSPYPLEVARTVAYRPSGLAQLRVLSRSLAAVRALLQHHRARDFERVITHDALLSVLVRRALPEMPLLQTFHSPFVDENRLNNWTFARNPLRRLGYPLSFAAARLADRQALNAVDAVHTLSDYTWKLLGSHYPAACARVRWERIPAAVDTGRYRPSADRGALRRRLGIAGEATVLLSVRRLIPRNGVDRILSAAAALADRFPEVLFLVAGGGVLEEPLRSEARRRGLGARVRMLGFVPEAELPAHYQAADAFLLPTRELECFGVPVIEAMACRLHPPRRPAGRPGGAGHAARLRGGGEQ